MFGYDTHEKMANPKIKAKQVNPLNLESQKVSNNQEESDRNSVFEKEKTTNED